MIPARSGNSEATGINALARAWTSSGSDRLRVDDERAHNLQRAMDPEEL